MTTEQDAILRRYFTLKHNQDWIALQWRTPLRGFKTQRVAKVTSEGRLLFTIGETDKGQACDLNTAIAAIIQHHGLLVVREACTSPEDGIPIWAHLGVGKTAERWAKRRAISNSRTAPQLLTCPVHPAGNFSDLACNTIIDTFHPSVLDQPFRIRRVVRLSCTTATIDSSQRPTAIVAVLGLVDGDRHE